MNTNSRPENTMESAGNGPLLQRMRLASGLVLFGYVLFHYCNHALGHVSLAAMERMLDLQEWVIDNPVGLLVLYGALFVHIALGLWQIAQIRTLRRPAWEWAQILFGLAIPWFLIDHLTYTRGTEQILGIDIDYRQELMLLWPGAAFQQSMLMLVVWIHGCIGMHYWLRIRDWYPDWSVAAAVLAGLVPLAALTGWINAARTLTDRLQLLAEQDATIRAELAELIDTNRFIVRNMNGIAEIGQWTIVVIAGALLTGVALRWYLLRRRRKVRIQYESGAAVTAAPGETLLDISRSAGIPHMSVCGGRARCSTCRTLVIEGLENLTEPTEAEKSLLAKINADENVRLACQTRANGDARIRPMIPPGSRQAAPNRAGSLDWGVERELAVMFLDVRGFSRISERALPYDVIYILNILFDEVGHALEHRNGYIDKYMGDGIMALFGLETDAAEASRAALQAALDAHDATARASKMLRQHLADPLRIGIGIHVGQAVVGRVGRLSDGEPGRLTAIGDTVNIAARLEAATKEFQSALVVSAETFRRAAIDPGAEDYIRKTIQVRNISEPVDIVAVREFSHLREQIEPSMSISGGTGQARTADSATSGQTNRG